MYNTRRNSNHFSTFMKFNATIFLNQTSAFEQLSSVCKILGLHHFFSSSSPRTFRLSLNFNIKRWHYFGLKCPARHHSAICELFCCDSFFLSCKILITIRITKFAHFVINHTMFLFFSENQLHLEHEDTPVHFITLLNVPSDAARDNIALACFLTARDNIAHACFIRTCIIPTTILTTSILDYYSLKKGNQYARRPQRYISLTEAHRQPHLQPSKEYKIWTSRWPCSFYQCELFHC